MFPLRTLLEDIQDLRSIPSVRGKKGGLWDLKKKKLLY